MVRTWPRAWILLLFFYFVVSDKMNKAPTKGRRKGRNLDFAIVNKGFHEFAIVEVGFIKVLLI